MCESVHDRSGGQDRGEESGRLCFWRLAGNRLSSDFVLVHEPLSSDSFPFVPLHIGWYPVKYGTKIRYIRRKFLDRLTKRVDMDRFLAGKYSNRKNRTKYR